MRHGNPAGRASRCVMHGLKYAIPELSSGIRCHLPGSERTQMTSQPICVAPTGDRCGDGVVWHEAHAAAYWTDINRFLIHRFNPADRTVRSWSFEEPVTALALTNRNDVLAVALGSRVILWEPETDLRRNHAFQLEGRPRVRLNEGRADPRGSLWVGSMCNNVNADESAGEAGGQDGIQQRESVSGEFLARTAGRFDRRLAGISLELPVLWGVYRSGRPEWKN